MTGLARRFSRRRHMSSSRIHCYIQNLRENTSLSKMSCFVAQSSVLRLKKKKFVLFSSLRTPDPFLLLGDPRLLFSLPGNWLSRVTKSQTQLKWLSRHTCAWHGAKCLPHTMQSSSHCYSHLTTEEVKAQLVMDREVWHAAVHRVAKSQTWLSDWTELARIDTWDPLHLSFQYIGAASHMERETLSLPGT